MVAPSIAVLVSMMAGTSDTTIVLSRVVRDLTGDGIDEVLTVVGAGPSADSLTDVQLTIESGGRIVYQFRLAPLTRTVGYDADRHTISAEEHRARLRDFANWFFDDSKFQSPAAFVDLLRRSLRLHVAEIPTVMARHRAPDDASDTAALWEEMQGTRITIFTFSPGGDTIVAIGWSSRTKRFYRLLECC